MPAPLSPLIQSLPATVPFVGPEAQERERGRPFRARIGANESVFGPSPKAIAAMQAAAGEAWMYGDPEIFELKGSLAARLGMRPENVAVGGGIDGLLGDTVRLFVEPGAAVVTSAGAYPTFNYHVQGFGGRLVTVPYRDDYEDPDSLLAAATREDARLIYLANPDNPMGSWWGGGVITEMIARLPDRCTLLLDEAYIEFAPAGAAPPVDPADPRLLRFRTFSKAHGLAGLRVGYVLGEAGVIASYDRIRHHFGVGRLAQAAALASLQDEAHLVEVAQRVAAARERIARIARANGLRPLPSATNFVAIDCGHDGAFARRVLAALLERDVFVRMPGVAPLDRCIRISAGLAPDLDLLEAALPDALRAGQAS
jgi:histidinol-phosphate aminotransferase